MNKIKCASLSGCYGTYVLDYLDDLRSYAVIGTSPSAYLSK